MKNKLSFIAIILLVCAIIFFVWEYIYETKDDPSLNTNNSSISMDECTKQGGEIVNTLSEEISFTSDKILGEIDDARCPCMCIKK
jgi:hypothetical protein